VIVLAELMLQRKMCSPVQDDASKNNAKMCKFMELYRDLCFCLLPASEGQSRRQRSLIASGTKSHNVCNSCTSPACQGVYCSDGFGRANASIDVPLSEIRDL
jgi:hypothetical protein